MFNTTPPATDLQTSQTMEADHLPAVLSTLYPIWVSLCEEQKTRLHGLLKRPSHNSEDVTKMEGPPHAAPAGQCDSVGNSFSDLLLWGTPLPPSSSHQIQALLRCAPMETCNDAGEMHHSTRQRHSSDQQHSFDSSHTAHSAALDSAPLTGAHAERTSTSTSATPLTTTMHHEYASTSDLLTQNLTMSVGNPTAGCHANIHMDVRNPAGDQHCALGREAVQESLDY